MMMTRIFLVMFIFLSTTYFEISIARLITDSNILLYRDHEMMNQTNYDRNQYISVGSDFFIGHDDEDDDTIICKPAYSFLPCTDRMWGHVFLIVVYEYLLSMASAYNSTGTELFFTMFGTGIFGASFFQILGMIPRAILVFVSGLSGSKENIQSSAAMGMGLVAGSVMMSLTLIWGSVVIFGSHDISNTSDDDDDDDSDEQDDQEEGKTPINLLDYGVTTDKDTKYTARIMLSTLVPFLILEFSKFFHSRWLSRGVVIFSFVLSLVYLIVYCTYQVFQPWIQDKRLEFLMYQYVQKHLLQKLLTSNGKPDKAKIKTLFKRIDKNGDKALSPEEIELFIMGMNIDRVGLDESDFAAKIMGEFDISGDGKICEAEFVHGLMRWVKKANKDFGNKQTQDENRVQYMVAAPAPTGDHENLIERRKQEIKSRLDLMWNYCKAAFLIILGTAMTLFLGSPLMQSIQAFADGAGIPSFLVSYSIVPLALNYKSAISSIKTALEKTEKALSLTFCEIYGGVFLNNMMGLTVFLMLIILRDLIWDVSAEVLVVFVVCTTVGLLASLSTRIPLIFGIFAYLLYPLSLVLLFVLTGFLGWK